MNVNAHTTAIDNGKEGLQYLRRKKLRILYVSGPGDVIGTYGYWKAGREDPSEVSVTYSGQFYTLCRQIDAIALILAQRPTRRHMSGGTITIIERMVPFQRSRCGALYHLGQFLGGLGLVVAAWRFSADVILVSEGTHWFMLSLVRAMGIRVVPDLQCSLWPSGNPPKGRIKRIIQSLNGWFWKRIPSATLCISPECERQVRQISDGLATNLIATRPSYQRDYAQEVTLPPQPNPFRLMFAGRIERNKGVFDLLEVLAQLQTKQNGQIACVICGSGSADSELARKVQELGLSSIVTITGQLNRAQMLKQLSASHAVIVPTTAGFAEGFTRVVIEGVLAGRPVIASSVCNASGPLGKAIIEVAPGDISAMVEAVLRLKADSQLYASMRSAATEASSQFYDLRWSWGAGLQKAIELVENELNPTDQRVA